MWWKVGVEARQQKSSMVAKIIRLSRGRCDVQLPDGREMRGIHFALGYSWPIDTWVVIERVRNDWQVIGNGPHASEVYVAPVIPVDPPVDLTGIWDTTWGNLRQGGLGISLADPGNWQYPGDPPGGIFTYPSDMTPPGNGLFSKPEGLLWHPSGKAILVHRMSDSSGDLFVPLKIKVRFLVPATGTLDWNQEQDLEINLTELRDQDLNEMEGDSKVFYSPETGYLTILGRVASVIPSGVASTNQSSVWTIHLNEDGSFVGTYMTGSITVGTDKTARKFSVDGSFAAKLDLGEDVIYGYQQQNLEDNGDWSDIWNVSWKTAFNSVLGDDHVLVGGGTSISGPNFGYPSFNNLWLTLVTAYKESVSARAIEMRVNAEDGNVNDYEVIHAMETLIRGDIPKNQIACDAATEYLLSALTAYAPASSSETRSTPAGPPNFGSIDYTYTADRIWVEPLYSSHLFTIESVADDGSRAFPGFYPPGALPTSDTLVYPAAPIILPARTPNLDSRSERLYWAGGGGSARYVCTPLGRRYCALLIPVKHWVPNPVGQGWLHDDYDGYEYIGVHAIDAETGETVPIETKTHTLQITGLLPVVKACYELVFVGLAQALGGNPAIYIPNGRHTDIELPLSGTSNTFSTGTDQMPIGENFYQALPIEDLGIVIWLHDHRAGWVNSAVPMITVTDLDMNFLYEIPSNQLVPTDQFVGNQVYNPVDVDVIWAYDGEEKYRYHNLDETGPLMKAWKKDEFYFLAVAFEYYDRVEPTNGTSGFTWQKTIIFRVDATAAVAITSDSISSSWIHPSVGSPGMQLGPHTLRHMAIGDRLVVPQANNSLRQVTG